MQILRSVPVAAHAPIALTIGNFDGVHRGHQAMLSRLREIARRDGLAACAMTFEPNPREFFAPDQAPTRLTSLREKLELLAAHQMDRTYICRFDYRFAQIHAEDFIERILVRGLGVKRLLVGDEFRFGARRAGDVQLLRAGGGRLGYRVDVMDSVTYDGERISSTAVRAALAAGELPRAAQLLGRPYSISGRVVRGDGMGRRLGFPTANVQMKHNRPPVLGIFAVEVSGAGDRPVRGVASLGLRPTLKPQGAPPVLEAHLFDFDRDIYGQHLRVDFFQKFRDEEKYADLGTLTRQIADDAEHAREYFARRDAALKQGT
ncbi:MAG: bifunctional riboflavin kinase/FAD synthetase [Steroidobacteraceae bacterium]